jgi:hypothetical protein
MITPFYLVGQYGLVKGKAFPFDVDTKVPFLVRGPGIRRSLKSELVANIDIAPTFLHIAGLQVLHFKTQKCHIQGGFRIRIDIMRIRIRIRIQHFF